MLKKLYVDNFRSLVNFELPLNEVTLLLGPNGSGKTAVFEVLRAIRDFVSGIKSTKELFATETLTRWETRDVQVLELTVSGQGSEFVYHLETDHDRNQHRCRVRAERLLFSGHPLYESALQEGQLRAQLYRDDHSLGPPVLVDWTRSGIAHIQPRYDNQFLTWFKKRMERVIAVRMNPASMSPFAAEESSTLAWDASNFVAWFRSLVGTDLDLMSKLRPDLNEAVGGFETLRLSPSGADTKVLEVKFKSGDTESRDTGFVCRFDELSDGERALVVLYTSLYCVDSDYTLCLDEPENFLALREIQPWLNLVIDKARTQTFQAVLISHHPELINALAVGSGRWLDRPSAGPTRSREIGEDGSGLPVSELVARGWLA